MNDNFLSRELEDTLKSVIKHALFGNRDSLHLVLDAYPQNIKEYMLLNLTKFANNLVDLITKIKINTKGYALLIKDVEDIDDPIKTIKIVDNDIFFKGNYLINFSDNMMIDNLCNKNKLISSQNINMYDSLVTVLMSFFYNSNFLQSLKENTSIYAKLNFDQTSEVIKNMIYKSI